MTKRPLRRTIWLASLLVRKDNLVYCTSIIAPNCLALTSRISVETKGAQLLDCKLARSARLALVSSTLS